MTKILIHGATNWGSSNFGDYLYADATVRRIHKQDEKAEIRFAEPSDYFLKYLPEYAKCAFDEKDADLLVYIPGGYFGEGHGYGLRDKIIHFIRFLPVGIRASYRKQKICIVGIGAGPITFPALKWGIKRICNAAISLTVRDIESQNSLEAVGVTNAELVFDPIISLPLRDWSVPSVQLDAFDGSRKTLLVHYNHSKVAAVVFADAVNRFVSESGEAFNVVVSSDQLLSTEDELFDLFSSKIDFPIFRYQYDNPYEFISLLDRCDYILTCKLHVGVVGMMLGASVVCAAEHPEKTKRYYSHIGCPERCVSLYDNGSEAIITLMQDNLGNSMPPFNKSDLDLAEAAWQSIDQSIGL